MLTLKVNGSEQQVDVPEDMPLLWVLRDVIGLTGTKFGCGIAQCGACTVHVDGMPVRSCVMTSRDAAGKGITTIEAVDTTKGRQAAEGSLARAASTAMWLLPVRTDHGRCGAFGRSPQSERS